MPTDPTTPTDDPPEADELAETFPVLMVYTTLRLSAAGGWRWSARVATPDNVNVLASNATAGGSIEIGARKVVKYLQDAIAIALEQLDETGEPFQ